MEITTTNSGSDRLERKSIPLPQSEPEVFPINLDAFPGLTKEHILQFAESKSKQFSEWFDPIGKNIEKMHRMYNNKPARKSRMVYPTIYSIVETISARVAPTLFNRVKFVEAFPEYPVMTPEQKEKQVDCEDFINQSMAWMCKTPEKGKQITKAMGLEGLTILRSMWKQEESTVNQPQYEQDPVTGAQVFVGESPVTVSKGRFDYESRSMFEMEWEPKCWRNIASAEWVFEKAKMSLNQLFLWEKDGKIQDVNLVAEKVPESVNARGEGARKDWEQERLNAIGRGQRFARGDDKEYQIRECFAWIPWRMPDEGEQKGQITTELFHFMIAEGVLISFDKCELDPKRIPYISVPMIVNTRELVGKAIPEPIEPLWDNINTVGDTQAELVAQAADPLTFYEQRSGMSQRQSLLARKGYVPVEQASGILRPPVNTAGIQANMQYLQFMMTLARDASAATEQAQGIGSDANTLGEFQGLLAGAMSRFAEMIDTATVYLFPYLAKECHLFYKQFGVDGQMFVLESTTNGTSKPITKETLAGDYTWIPVTTANAGDEAKKIEQDDAFLFRMLDIQAKQGGQPVDLGGGTTFDIGKWVTRIMENRKIKGREFVKALPAPPPMAPGGLETPPMVLPQGM